MDMDRPYSKLERVVFPKVFLATPMDKNKNIHGETAVFCSYTASLPDVLWGHTGTISPEMSRNTLIEDHIHNVALSEDVDEWTHVLFIDTDVVPPQHCLDDLISLDADICVGVYPLFLKEGFLWSVSDMKGDLIPMTTELPKEPFDTVSCGAGCLLIRKEVLEETEWPYFKMIYQPKWDNFGNPIKSMEDLYFCNKALSAGFRIIVNPNVICKHYNSIDLLKAFAFVRSSHGTDR